MRKSPSVESLAPTPEPPPETVAAAPSPTPEPPDREPTERIESWREFEPGDGFLVGRNKAGELSISAYALLRYINQTPNNPSFTDHLGNYQILAADAGIKYKGLFLQAELYQRRLGNFVADGPLPVASIEDEGFYVQAAFFPIKQKLELYGLTSQIFGDDDAGFDDSSEYGLGLNFYVAEARNHRLNFQALDVNHSPVSSTFGYYVGGLDGTIWSTAFSVYF